MTPSFNETNAIAQVIAACRHGLPAAALHVFDNRSTDGTADVVRVHGAEVTHVALRRKSHVAQRMFADVYLMVVSGRADDGRGAQTRRAGHRLIAAMLSQVTGAILHHVTLGRQEATRFAYLSAPLKR